MKMRKGLKHEKPTKPIDQRDANDESELPFDSKLQKMDLTYLQTAILSEKTRVCSRGSHKHEETLIITYFGVKNNALLSHTQKRDFVKTERRDSIQDLLKIKVGLRKHF